MQIYNINSLNTISYTGLVKRADYKGPILKLTKKEQKEISNLRKAIAEYELQLYEDQKNRSFKKAWTEKDQYLYNENGFSIDVKIEKLLDRIEEIKRNRINIQREKAKTLKS